MKKHLLLICHRIPYPPNKGDKIRAYNILRFLSQKFQIHLAFMIDDLNDINTLDSLRPLVNDIFYDVISPKWKKFLSGRALLGSQPVSVPYFYSRRLQRSIDNLLQHQPMDVVFCSSSPSAEYIFRSSHYNDKLQKAKWIMDFIDVDSHKWRQYSATCKPPMQWLYKREAESLLAYETRIAREFHHLLLVSESEKSLFARYCPGASLDAVSNGVDLDFFSPGKGNVLPKNSCVLAFTGAMDYWPNVEGVEWFVNQVWPMVRKDTPDAVFYIVGSHPSPNVKQLAEQKGVTVTGFVPDVRDYLTTADICVVPLKIARGIQNKVLEAMAMAKAVVCTPQALEGIRAEAGKDVLVAQGAENFAKSIKQLLENKNHLTLVGHQARLCIEQEYSWDKNLARLDKILEF